jgi:hypothetical protein
LIMASSFPPACNAMQCTAIGSNVMQCSHLGECSAAAGVDHVTLMPREGRKEGGAVRCSTQIHNVQGGVHTSINFECLQGYRREFEAQVDAHCFASTPGLRCMSWHWSALPGKGSSMPCLGACDAYMPVCCGGGMPRLDAGHHSHPMRHSSNFSHHVLLMTSFSASLFPYHVLPANSMNMG